jgi:uncharacterized membrane protein YfcA
VIGYFLALLIGLSLGILGGGGSILTVPIFVYVMGFPPKQAIAMSLPVIGATSLVGAVRHWRARNFDLRAALGFGVFAMAGARLGAGMAKLVAGAVQLGLLGITMMLAATMMLRRRALVEQGPTAKRSAAAMLATAAVGLGVGVLTGLVGIGGGFLFVPALVLISGLTMKQAIGTSLFVIALSTAAGTLGYRGQAEIPWRVVGLFTAIAVIGLYVGTRVVDHVSQQALRRAFAYFLIVMAAFILVQNRAVLLHPNTALRPSAAGSR